ncbi:MAG: N-acetylmuramoyl-L-alanine amidase [Ruminococcaceae bacterium]|nr:N-acetylmuramoyl-L-alanine amidase [Oscillospiraceae bacterium]
MAYTNSSLATVKILSPNHSGQRNHIIDTITIHCVVGQTSAKTLGEIFLPTSRQASSNYGIGFDGEIGLYVEEKNRSWCTSSASNDHRAITIEVASDTTEPYAVTDKAYAALLDLVTDICKRNGIKKLVWSNDKNDRVNHKNGCNMTVHRDYANKSCPGKYLYDRHPAIAAEVNKRLSGNATTDKNTKEDKVMYRVQIGAFSVKANAENMLKKAKAAGFTDAFITTTGTTAQKVETTTPALKSIDEIAKEVINGKWGNGEERKKKLTAAGYNYAKVQARVNELCK